MDKFLNATRLLCAVLFLTLSAFNNAAYAGNIEEAQIIEQRVYNLNTVVNLKYTSKVADKINFYINEHRAISEVLLGRVTIYFPLFENVLREKGMPESLKYLPIIESGLRPDITSKAGAAGLWQFMKSTAKMFDLSINRTIDERRDPLKSTYAAADYLQHLFDIYQDWTLAIAAYNCGPGKVNYAIKKSGSTDYWELEKYLPKETRNYIPKFIAATYLMNYYHEHEIIPQEPNENLKNTATAKVFSKVNFNTLSDSFELDMNVIKMLNPAFLKNYIPESEDGRYTLTLPQNKLYDFLERHGSFEDLLYLSYSDKPDMSEQRLVELNSIPSLLENQNAGGNLNLERKLDIGNITPPVKRTRLGRGDTYQSVAYEKGLNLNHIIDLNKKYNKDKTLIRIK